MQFVADLKAEFAVLHEKPLVLAIVDVQWGATTNLMRKVSITQSAPLVSRPDTLQSKRPLRKCTVKETGPRPL